MAKISVIIPSFNQQEFLSNAIDSVLDQTVKPHEIIVIDDGSTDDSLKIAQSYRKEHIREYTPSSIVARMPSLKHPLRLRLFLLSSR